MLCSTTINTTILFSGVLYVVLVLHVNVVSRSVFCFLLLFFFLFVCCVRVYVVVVFV